MILVGPAEEIVVKKSFNLKLLETKSVQIATFVGLGWIDWEEEADKEPSFQKNNHCFLCDYLKL